MERPWICDRARWKDQICPSWSIYVRVSANMIMKLNDEVKIPPEENVSEKKDQQSVSSVTSTISSEEDQEDKPSFTDEVGEEDNQENITNCAATAFSETDDTSDIPQIVTSETATERNKTNDPILNLTPENITQHSRIE